VTTEHDPALDEEREMFRALASRRVACALGHTIVVVDETPSTQDDARARAARGARHGTVVIALAQTAGRGRRGRTWTMLEGALAVSIVLRPTMPTEHLARITQMVAAALTEALLHVGVVSFVKWPNDVLVAVRDEGPLGPYRKVAGILVESAFSRGALEHVIVGVGVNVRGHDAVPDELREIASALDVHGARVSRVALLEHVLDALEGFLESDLEESWARALATCRTRSATLGRRVRVDEEGITGTARAIDDEGALVVALDDGSERVVRTGDVLPSAPPLST
jgi:BirA family biotin operon repressor/biotin-[acetyl-CoA-carboxylase] ligase